MMAAPPVTPRRAAPLVALLNGVFERLGDVVGPGALRSLVRYGSQGEGARLVAGDGVNGVDSVAAAMRDVLDVDVQFREDPIGTITARLPASSALNLSNPGGAGLVAGILEGAVSAVKRRRFVLVDDPQLKPDGALEIVLRG